MSESSVTPTSLTGDLTRPLTIQELSLIEAKTEQTKTMTEDQHAFNLVMLEKTRSEARIIEIERQKAERGAVATEADDLLNCYYVFDHEVSGKSVGLCLQRLNYWHRTKPGSNIELVFHSEGGSIPDGFALFDRITQLRAQGHHVTTSALGVAASMAAILIQAGDLRTMGKESWLLVHEGGLGVQGSSGQVKDTADWFKRMQDRLAAIIIERAQEAGRKGTASKPLTLRQLKERWNRKDWWISSEEALEMGLVDEVV